MPFSMYYAVYSSIDKNIGVYDSRVYGVYNHIIFLRTM
jgi:hypothetical protein